MEILRVPPYTTTTVDFDIPSGYTSEEFEAIVTDMADLSTSSQTFSGSANESVSILLNAAYDSDYLVQVFDSSENLISSETYTVVRPYAVAENYVTTATEINDFKKNEEIARAIIDSVIPQGFYYKKKTIEASGTGSDYLPIWHDAKKIISVYENNVLVTDRQFEITKDKSAITQKYDGTLNRFESAPSILPLAASDIADTGFVTIGAFAKTYDYKVVVESGYTAVPSDITRAAEILVDDISCGRLDYYQRYMSSYNTDQFKISFDKKMFEGTGNIIVDKILSKYAKSITRLGVL